MNKVYFISMFFLLCLACNDKEEIIMPLYENPYVISGSLSVRPGYLDATSQRTLSGQKVYIRVDTGSNKSLSNYFASATTGSGGSFTFYVSDTTVPYAVFSMVSYQSSPTYSMLYYGIVRNSSPFGTSLPLIVVPDTTMQNGIDISTLDINMSRVSRVNLAIYTSPDIALSDADSLSGNGCLLRATTDSMGRAFIGNLPQDKLYINAQLIVGKDTFSAKAYPTQVPKQKLVPLPLIIKKQ